MAVSDIKVEVCVFAFDLLYLDGQPLIQRELNVRREVEFLHCFCQFQTPSLSFLCSYVHAAQLALMVTNVFSLLFLSLCVFVHGCCRICIDDC